MYIGYTWIIHGISQHTHRLYMGYTLDITTYRSDKYVLLIDKHGYFDIYVGYTQVRHSISQYTWRIFNLVIPQVFLQDTPSYIWDILMVYIAYLYLILQYPKLVRIIPF